ncbi:ATP-binding protein [Sinosporangium album]|nr:ATP-binding protein [Sinosporangium album]
MELPAHPIAASHARRLAVHTLARWDMQWSTDMAELIMSELVANAVKATGELRDLARAGDASGLREFIRVGLYRFRGRIVIEVWDRGRTPPRTKSGALDDENGRGLQIVDDLADQWGYRWLATGGKVVWATITPHA